MSRALFNEEFECVLCHTWHALRTCPRFLASPPERKAEYVAKHHCCSNCLAQSHTFAECTSIDRCKRCPRYHNTWLHPIASGKIWFNMTAQVQMWAPNQSKRTVRIMINPGCPSTVIDVELARSLGCDTSGDKTRVRLSAVSDEYPPLSVRCDVRRFKNATSPRAKLDVVWCLEATDSGTHDADLTWYRPLPVAFVLGSEYAGLVLKGKVYCVAAKHGKPFRQTTIFGTGYFGEAQKQ